MKKLLLLALCALALPAAATVYQPGLWFYHDDTHEWVDESVPIRDWPGVVPCQGTFMEYTRSTDEDPRGSNGQSGTNAYDNAVYTWHTYEMFGYGGQWFVEKGKTYTLSYYHGRYVWCNVDGNVRILYSTGWWNHGNAKWTAPKTGWVDFDFRGGINGESYVGPLHNDCGVAFNTEGLNYADATWGAPPWQRFIDPGDCSLLRIVKSETDYMTLDSVAVDGDDLAVVASFADVPSEGVLTAFYGASNGGDLPSAWAHSAVLGTVAAGSAASVPYTVPGAAGANFVALRLQRTDYATDPYTQFTAATPVPKPVPTFDLSCDDIGYTNMTFTAVVAAVGTGASSVSARIEIATDAAFSHIVTNLPLSLAAAGSETVYTSGLVSNTVHYARVAGSNNANASNVSATVGPLRTLLPTISTSTIEALEHGLGALNAAVTVTDWGLDSTGARVRLEAAESRGFNPIVGVSEEVDAMLGVATNLMIIGLREDYLYDLRARIVNSWGFVEYQTLPNPQRTRGRPFVGTPLVWETDSSGRLVVHERLVDNEFAGEAELFLGGVSQGVRAFSAGPCRISWTGLAQPAWPVEARVVVRVVVSTRPYSEEWRATVVPGSASYLEDKWVYDPVARTLSWTDSYPTLNVVSNVTANMTANPPELTIGSNKNNSLALNLDFSPGVEGGWAIAEIAGEAPFGSGAVITNLVCPPTLRKIGRAAFENNKTIRHVTFNEGLEILGPPTGANNCFNGCTSLVSISAIPSTVTNIGPSVFAGCSSLASDVSWPGSLRVVPNKAFYGSSIRSFKAAYGVTHVGAYGDAWSYPFGKCNAVRDIDLPVTLQYVSSRLFGDATAAAGFGVNVWYRGFPKLGWHKQLWDNSPYGKTTVTNWFEWHHRDEFRAFAETNQTFEIRLPETYRGEGTWKASGCNQVVRWWKDPDQFPPSVMILR